MAFSRARADSSRAEAVRLRTTTISGSSPARRQARAESYSQLVPGNTGMATLGRAVLDLHTAGERLSQERVRAGADSPARVGYTSSSTLSLRASSSSMGAESPPMVITGSAVVTPSLLARGKSISSVSSATMERGQGVYQFVSTSGPMAKPILLPKDMFMTVSAKPCSTAHAAFTFPALCSSRSLSQAARGCSARASPANRYTGCPASLNSGESTSPAWMGAMAKEISVGGTSRSWKVPDMESLPPMAAQPSSNWASRAPSRAAKGLPQRVGSSRSFSKNSWRVR